MKETWGLSSKDKGKGVVSVGGDLQGPKSLSSRQSQNQPSTELSGRSIWTPVFDPQSHCSPEGSLPQRTALCCFCAVFRAQNPEQAASGQFAVRPQAVLPSSVMGSRMHISFPLAADRCRSLFSLTRVLGAGPTHPA